MIVLVNVSDVTVITATNLSVNRLEFLKQAAESVRQERKVSGWFQWIVVVNGVNDLDSVPQEVSEVAKILRCDEHNVSAARNMALDYVESKALCTLDDDDILLPGSISVRAHALTEDVGWVAAHMSDVVDDVVQPFWEQPLTAGLYPVGGLLNKWGSPELWFIASTHSFLIRTVDVKRHGGWRRMGQEDIALIACITEEFNGIVLSDVVLGYRRHDSQVSRSDDAVDLRVAESQAVFDLARGSK